MAANEGGVGIADAARAAKASYALDVPAPLWYARSNPKARRSSMASPVERFWAQVKRTSACWLWMGQRNHKGYGRLYVNGQNVLAHRLSWQMHRGPIPEGKLICHHCDVPGCVNPEHLFVGTYSDNMLDCARKGRMSRKEKTRCHYGHPLSGRNVYPRGPDGKWRECLTCKIQRNARRCRAKARRGMAIRVKLTNRERLTANCACGHQYWEHTAEGKHPGCLRMGCACQRRSAPRYGSALVPRRPRRKG